MSDDIQITLDPATDIVVTAEFVGINDAAIAQEAAEISTAQAAVSTAQAVVSTSQADTSTTQAAVATAQAAIATAQAGIATAEAALTAADRVQTGLDAASTAADVISTAANKAAAEAAQAAAEQAADNFDDVYLKSKTADPTTDNDGGPLVGGELYWNTAIGALKVYNATTLAWVTYNPLVGVAGPATSTDHNLAAFSGTSGLTLEDSGIALSSVLTASDVGVTLQGYDATTLKAAAIGVTVQGYDAATLKSGAIGVTVQGYDATTLKAAAIGVTAQGYDAQLSSLIRQNSQSAAYTLVLTDGGKHIYHPPTDTTARIWTIPANASVAFPIGTAITFDNDFGAGPITIAITTDTLVLVGLVGSTGSRTLASGGQATAYKVAATRWRILGSGLT